MSTNNNYISKISVGVTTHDIDGCGGLSIGTNYNEVFNDLEHNKVDDAYGYNHIEGIQNISKSHGCLVSGYYNEPIPGGLWLIGCGTSSQRKNAFAVDVNGKLYIKNKVSLIDELHRLSNVLKSNSFPKGIVIEVKNGSLMHVAIKADVLGWTEKSNNGSYTKYVKK